MTSFQNSVMYSVGIAKVTYNQFINCGPDPSGATFHVRGEQTNVSMTNFVNISTKSSFLTMTQAQLFIDYSFIELKNCGIFISIWKSDNTEYLLISNSNIVASVNISNSILETKSVNKSEARNDMTFINFENIPVPICNYLVHECTCESNKLRFFFIFAVFISI